MMFPVGMVRWITKERYGTNTDIQDPTRNRDAIVVAA